MCPEAGSGPIFCRIATGQYTGDGGAAHALVGIGFRVRHIYIQKHLAADGNTQTWRTNDQAPNFNVYIPFNAGSLWRDNQIVSLDGDGFTVGWDGGGGPNGVATLYDYTVWG